MMWTAPTNEHPATFKISATPYPYSQMGFRSFFMDQTFVVRGADRQGQDGNENDPPIEDEFYKSANFGNFLGIE